MAVPVLDFNQCKKNGDAAAYKKPHLWACRSPEPCDNRIYSTRQGPFCRVPLAETTNEKIEKWLGNVVKQEKEQEAKYGSGGLV